jgi:hypothetical protein
MMSIKEANLLYCPYVRSFFKIDNLYNKYPLVRMQRDSTYFDENIQSELSNKNQKPLLKTNNHDFDITEEPLIIQRDEED